MGTNGSCRAVRASNSLFADTIQRMTPSYSIRYQVRRVTNEVTSISVPITPELLTLENRIDAEKASQLAVEIARDSSTKWKLDGDAVISLNFIQGPELA